MQSIYYSQILYLVFQCFIVAFVLLSLFRLRTYFGLSLVFTALGVFQYMQVFLANALYFEVYPNIFVSSGSSIIFTGSVFAILLIYIKEDAIEARKAIYGILAANIILSIIQYSISFGMQGDKVLNLYNLPAELFNQSFKISLIGTILIFLDTFLIIFVYEAISKKVSSIFFRILFSTIFILSIDSVLFAAGAFYGTNQVERIIISGLLSKNFAAIIYTIIFTIYLKYIDKGNIKLDAKENVFTDIFHSLTFRQKYESLFKENETQKNLFEQTKLKYKYLVNHTTEGFYRVESEIPIAIDLPINEQIDLMYKHMFIAECNDTFAKLYGFSKSNELIGYRFLDLHGGKLQPTNVEALNNFIKNNYTIIDAYTVEKNKKGKTCNFLNNADGVIVNNSLISFWGTQRDVTEKRNAEIALIEANTIINRSQSVAFLWKNDENWPVQFVSENVLKLTGYTVHEFKNKNISYTDIIYSEDTERVYREVKIASSNNSTTHFKHQPYRIITKNNQLKWVEDESYIRRNEKGEITHYEGIVNDITDKVNKNIQLINEKNKAQNYLNVAGVILVSINTKGIVELINPKGCEILGYTEDEIIGTNWFDSFIPKNQRNKIKEIGLKILKGEIEGLSHYENAIINKNGEERLIAWNNVIIKDEIGNITSVLSSGEDITESKKIQETLKINEEKYRTLFEYAPEGILIADTDSNYLDANTAMCKMLGYTHQELIGFHASDIVVPTQIKNIQPALNAINSDNYYEKEWQFKRKDGAIFSAEVTVTTLPDGNLIALVKDITEEKELKANLIKEKELLKAIIDNIPVMITLYDPNINMLFLNKEFETKLEVTAKEIIDIDFMKLFYPDKEVRKQAAEFMLNAPKEWKEFPISTKSGTILNTEWTNIKLANGTQIGIGLDITEQKMAQKALIKFNDRLKIIHDIDTALLNATTINQITKNVINKLKLIVPYSHASVTEYNKNRDAFKFIYVNSVVPNITISNDFVNTSEYGFLNEDILLKGENLKIEDLRNYKIKSQNIQKAIDFGLHSFMLFPLFAEKFLVGTLSIFSDSTDIFTEDNVEIIQEIANKLAIVIHQNNLKQEIIEYTENLEEKIEERTEQLEFSNRELRDFAQIVSHDLKAPLRAISQLSYWISQDYADKIDDAGKEQLQMLIGRAKRLDNLIEGILQYSRAGRAREKEILIDINTIVNEVIISLNPPKNINIIFDTDLPKILADPTRIGQVFQNLINNAIKFNDKPVAIIHIGCLQNGNEWEFYISDNGPGIEEKYFDRIFQIFQRLETRDNQEGTGVGLSLVKRIIQIYSGKIWITSKINEGTTFHFTLPLKNINN